MGRMSTVAWRILWMTYQVRVDPNPSPTVAFSPLELSVLERVAATQKPTRPVGQPLTLQAATRAMANLGGSMSQRRWRTWSENRVARVSSMAMQLLCWWEEVSQNPS